LAQASCISVRFLVCLRCILAGAHSGSIWMRPPSLLAPRVGLPFLLLVLAGAGRSEVELDRSSTVLATDEGIAAESSLATSSLARLHEALLVHSHMIPGEGGRAMMKMMAGCVCILVLFKLVSMIDCYGKKLDCRRCRLCGRFLLWAGWDEFPTFRVTATVHSVADVKNQGMMGGEKVFKVKVAFKYNQFITTSTKDMRWDQTKGMEVPQGADLCLITLYSEGKIKDSKLGEYELEVKRDMLDGRKFWGEKKKFKLEDKGKLVGTILITFRNADDPNGGPADLPIDGIDEDSALAIAIRDSYEEMMKAGLVPRPPPPPPPPPPPEPGQPAEPPPEPPEIPKLEGNLKIDCLSRCITGPLREVDKEQKEAGKVYIRVINCNIAELKGDDMKEEAAKQWAKAQDKGLTELPKKWYWAWYEDKKAAFHDEKMHYPDGFIPMTAISKINRQPERNDQFVISYVDDGNKETLVYRREGGISLDVWLDGIDLTFTACRTQVKEDKRKEEAGQRG